MHSTGEQDECSLGLEDRMSAIGNEREASPVRIARNWPVESGRDRGSFPRGLEVLVKKASVDVAFREWLFEIGRASCRERV